MCFVLLKKMNNNKTNLKSVAQSEKKNVLNNSALNSLHG